MSIFYLPQGAGLCGLTESVSLMDTMAQKPKSKNKVVNMYATNGLYVSPAWPEIPITFVPNVETVKPLRNGFVELPQNPPVVPMVIPPVVPPRESSATVDEAFRWAEVESLRRQRARQSYDEGQRRSREIIEADRRSSNEEDYDDDDILGLVDPRNLSRLEERVEQGYRQGQRPVEDVLDDVFGLTPRAPEPPQKQPEPPPAQTAPPVEAGRRITIRKRSVI